MPQTLTGRCRDHLSDISRYVTVGRIFLLVLLQIAEVAGLSLVSLQKALYI